MSSETQCEFSFTEPTSNALPPLSPQPESKKKARHKNIFSEDDAHGAFITSPVKQTVKEDVFGIASTVHRQFQFMSPVKNQSAVLNIEEEFIAAGADNKVTKLIIRSVDGNITNLVVRRNHPGIEPHDSPLVDFIQAQASPLIAKRITKKSGKDKDGLAYVEEYYEYCAGSLTDVPILYADVPAFFLAIVKGVKWLHKLGYAHLDLKPDNILVGFDGLPKIADLDNLSPLHGLDVVITGTRSYMPPEVTHREKGGQIKDRRAVDAWSLGCMLYYLYMREAPPFNAKGEFAGFTDKIKKKFVKKSPSAFRAIRVIEKLLSNDPSERAKKLDKIAKDKLFDGIHKSKLLTCLQHGADFRQIDKIGKKTAHSDQLAQYQILREKCNKVSLEIHKKKQKAISDEAAYTALRTLLRSAELVAYKDEELKKVDDYENWSQVQKKQFLNSKEEEFLQANLQKAIEQKQEALSDKILQLKKEQSARTQKKLDHLIFETKIKIITSAHFKANETLCHKILHEEIPDSKTSCIPSREEWEKSFSRLHTLFGIYNKLKRFGLFIASYHHARNSADKIKKAQYLLEEIQAYPRAGQVLLLEDLREKVIAQIKLLQEEHLAIAPEIQSQLNLEIPTPIRPTFASIPKEALAAGQKEEDNLISWTAWHHMSEKFHIQWLNFKVGRKDVEKLDELVSAYSRNFDMRIRFKYAREIMIETESWLQEYKSNVRYEAVVELQRCAIYTFNRLLRLLFINERESDCLEENMRKLLKEPLAGLAENPNAQTHPLSQKTSQNRLARFFSRLTFWSTRDTLDLPALGPSTPTKDGLS